MGPGAARRRRAGDSPGRRRQEVRGIRSAARARDPEDRRGSRGQSRAGSRCVPRPGKVPLHVSHPDAGAGTCSAVLSRARLRPVGPHRDPGRPAAVATAQPGAVPVSKSALQSRVLPRTACGQRSCTVAAVLGARDRVACHVPRAVSRRTNRTITICLLIEKFSPQ